jgi:PST family polysaccharide transporter
MSVSFLRSVSIIGLANIMILIATFLRSVVLARSLDPHDFGLALLLITIMGGLDLLLDGGIDQLVVQSRLGGRRDMVAVAQTYRLASAAAASILLLAISDNLAEWLNAPELATPIKCLALIAIVRALTNLAYKKQQRNGRFAREAIIDIARFSAELLAIVALIFTTLGFWVVIISMFTNALVQMLISNLVFGEDWRGPLNRRARRLVGAFALPVTLNAMLLFVAMQGDRLIVASFLSPGQLALFAAVAALGQAGTAVMGRLTLTLTLSHFGSGKYLQAGLKAKVWTIHLGFIAGTVVIAAFLTLCLPLLVPLIYGPAYVGDASLILALACVSALQVEQGWLTALLTSAGRTRIFPYLTAIRAISLPIAAVALALNQSLVAVAIAALIGTQLAIWMSYLVLARMALVSRASVGLGLARSLAIASTIMAFYHF